MTIRVIVYTLIIGLICPFTRVTWGQQSCPVQPPPETMVEGPQRNTGTSSKSNIATPNNPIARNAVYFQNHYTRPRSAVCKGNLLEVRTLVHSEKSNTRTRIDTGFRAKSVGASVMVGVSKTQNLKLHS